MTIKIQGLQVKNLGPIDELKESLEQVNLFYGLNESGKTYLVEFLLHSLFRQAKDWDLRESVGKGSVQVQGLGLEPITFSPERKRKLEHFWDEDGEGLPLNMARLLVIKGGELALSTGSPGGVDRDTLKTALTSQALLDQIWDSIPSTVRNAIVDDGQILGKNMGMIKTQSELLREIHELEKLLEQIDIHYSQGPVREVEHKLEVAENKILLQRMAKRHLAYKVWEKINILNNQRLDLDKRGLQNLRDSIKESENLDKDIGGLETKLGNENKQSKDYPWLETAIELWEEKGLDKKLAPQKYLGIAGLVGIGIGAALLILENVLSIPELIWLGGSILGIGFLLSLYFGIRVFDWSSQIDDSAERKSIQAEFEKKFNTPLHGLADLKTQKSILQKIYIAAQATQSLVDEKRSQRKMLVQSIENSFLTLAGEIVSEKSWQPEFNKLSNRSETIDNNIQKYKLQLTELAIPEEVYNKEPPEIEYDSKKIQDLEKEISELKSELIAQQSDLETLKVRACERTGDDINQPWKTVLHNLQSLLEERIHDYKDLTADLVAKIGLANVLNRLREEEDQKIIQAINTESVSNILQKITGRYHKLDLVGDQIYVYDTFSNYALSDLSTGAKEQVQLALRLGIASQVCGGKPLFLILDDAFQHSDWQRRETLVQSILELAQHGWQILYLSMDDHIRDLFQKKVKPVLKSKYKKIDLS